MKECIVCGKKFTPKYYNSKCCSEFCQDSKDSKAKRSRDKQREAEQLQKIVETIKKNRKHFVDAINP